MFGSSRMTEVAIQELLQACSVGEVLRVTYRHGDFFEGRVQSRRRTGGRFFVEFENDGSSVVSIEWVGAPANGYRFLGYATGGYEKIENLEKLG